MPSVLTTTPVVMSVTCHDPSGGAGISADISTFGSLGCHCTPIITRISVRDTHSLKDDQVTDTSLLIEQIRAVLEDIPVDLFKLGDLGNSANAEAVHTILNDYPDIPVVIDPCLNAADGSFNRIESEVLRTLLFPHTTVAVLSEQQMLQLTPAADSIAACAQELVDCGCQYLLVTGDHGSSLEVANFLYSFRGLEKRYTRDRLPQSFHGAGRDA